jgi:hypothetical protein
MALWDIMLEAYNKEKLISGIDDSINWRISKWGENNERN